MDSFQITVDTHGIEPNMFWGSLMHGWLNEQLPAPFPEQLHQDEVKPLSQWIEVRASGVFCWHIQSLDAQLSEALAALLTEGQTIAIRHMGAGFSIREVRRTTLAPSAYMKQIFLAPQPCQGLIVRFRTTTTHRTGGQYALFPSVELMGRSLRQRLCQIMPESPLADDEALEQVLAHVTLRRYKLQSSTFSLEGHYVTGYFGSLELHFSGPDPVNRLAEMLFGIAPWTGIGIKTALGMGGCEVERIKERGRA